MTTQADESNPTVRQEGSGTQAQPTVPGKMSTSTMSGVHRPRPLPEGGQHNQGVTSMPVRVWEKLLSFYRENPASFVKAAKEHNITPYIAKKAWSEGWVGVYPAIAEIVQQEANEARARRAQAQADAVKAAREAARLEEDAKAKQAREDAVKSRAQEAQLIQLGRANVLLAFHSTVPILNALGKLVPQVAATLAATANPNPREVISLVRTLASITARTMEAGRLAMEMERLYLGEPTVIIGQGQNSMTKEEALAELAEIGGLLHARTGGVSGEIVVEAEEDEVTQDAAKMGLPSGL